MTDDMDTIDRHILFHLALDARHTSAPDITENLDVSAATIRNRIRQLEERRIIQGYHANIDYEQTGGRLTNLFICTADLPRREYFANEALQVPGVVHVRELMRGRRNLHVEAIGEDKTDITRIARDLSTLGLEIEDEALLQRNYHHPYEPFGPDQAIAPSVSNLTNLHELAGEAKVVDITVAGSSPAIGHRIRKLSEEDLLETGHLIVAIERGEDIITPNGETEIREGDLVTVLTPHGNTESLTELFAGPREASGSRPSVEGQP